MGEGASTTFELHLKVAETQLDGWVQGCPRRNWQDPDVLLHHGQIGLANFLGCHTRYHWLAVS